MMKRTLTLLLAVVLLATMLPLTAFAAKKQYLEVTKDNAPIRAKASEKGAIVQRCPKGTILEAEGSKINLYLNKWYKVRWKGDVCFIYSGNVKKVSLSNFTGALKLSKGDAKLNVSGSNVLRLKCTLKETGKSQTNVTWSTSDKTVATVSANGVVEARKPGEAVITARHKFYGTTAVCRITVVDSKKLSTTAREQSNNSCCSGAASRVVLQSRLGSSFKKTDLELFGEMGNSGVVYKVVNLLNKYLGKNTYEYVLKKNQKAYEDAVIASIRKGYPVIALVKITDSAYFKYTSNGHFTVISGYEVDKDGKVTFHVTDSFKTGKNGGQFKVPAKTFFSYSKSHGYPYYLILKK